MSLYGQYIKEREAFEIIENDHGFITYKIIGSDCYIRDIFVNTDFRHTGIGFRLAEEVSKEAKRQDCKMLIGTVVPSAFGSTKGLSTLLSYGMKLKSSTNDFIILEKDL